MKRILRIVAFLAVIVSFGSATAHAQVFEPPANDGFVTDAVPLLSPEQEQALETTLEQYQRETSNEIAILIVPSLNGEDIAQAAVEVGRKWGVGSQQNNGILLLMDYGNRDIMIATGYGLEGAVPDIVAKGVIDKDIAPLTREGKYYEGLAAGIAALQMHIGNEYTADRYVDHAESKAGGFFLFILFLLFNFGASVFGSTKSWWLGGVVGGVLGIVLTVLYAWWLSIPALVAAGLLFDYLVSRHPPRGGRYRGGGFGGGFGSGRSGGGFGGFGGGSFGGGGARGKF